MSLHWFLYQSLWRIIWKWRMVTISQSSLSSHESSNWYWWDDESEEGEQHCFHYCCNLWISRIHSRLLSIQQSSELLIILCCCSWQTVLWCEDISIRSFIVLRSSSDSSCFVFSTTESETSWLHQSRILFILSCLTLQVLCHSISPLQSYQCSLFWFWYHSLQESYSISSIFEYSIHCLSTRYNSMYWFLLCQIKSIFDLSLWSSSSSHQHHKRRRSTLDDESVSQTSSQTISSSQSTVL